MFHNTLEGWGGVGGGRAVQEEGDIYILWLIHVDIWQKPTYYCKAIIFQLKINKLKKELWGGDPGDSNAQSRSDAEVLCANFYCAEARASKGKMTDIYLSFLFDL